MIVFRSASDSNRFMAQGKGVWQCDKMPSKLKIGDPVFIKVNGEEEVHFLGLVESISRDSALPWPDMDFGSLTENVPTIKIKKVDKNDFNQSQGPFNYDKYDNLV